MTPGAVVKLLYYGARSWELGAAMAPGAATAPGAAISKCKLLHYGDLISLRRNSNDGAGAISITYLYTGPLNDLKLKSFLQKGHL